MRESSSQFLSQRIRAHDELRLPLALSIFVHLLVSIILLLAPNSLISGLETDMESAINIRLGGSSGAGEGGLTPMGGQPIQEVIPLNEARRPQWEQPPADTAPDLIVPIESAPRLEPQSEVASAPEEARGQRLRRGPTLQDGSTMAETGSTGMGLGLSAGGLGGDGSEIRVDDFCCPEYLSNMLSMIRQRWDPKQQVAGETVVRFTVNKDGILDSIEVEQSSGYLALDQSARRAILLTARIPRLPSVFQEDSLTVWITFEYRQ